jgi:hypothetical protein
VQAKAKATPTSKQSKPLEPQAANAGRPVKVLKLAKTKKLIFIE